MKKFIVPIIVLFIICIVCSAALAGTYQLANPIIEENERLEAEQARQAVLPDATGFTLLETPADLTGIVDIYQSANDVGYVITGQSEGFGGQVKAIVGIGNDGSIVGIKIYAAEETPGVGSKITNPEYYETYVGQTESLDGVAYISGATRSSKGLRRAVENVFRAYKAVTEGGNK